MEAELTTMHETINRLNDAHDQLKTIRASLPDDAKHAAVRRDADSLMARLKAWDTDMVSRRSRAYDDVENYEQKFTAHYLFLVNATESDLPRVNQPSRDRLAQLQTDWARLKSRSDAMINTEIPSLNRALWDLGFGAIWRR
jgi:hypothetical protein